jgi:hypothetical protein
MCTTPQRVVHGTYETGISGSSRCRLRARLLLRVEGGAYALRADPALALQGAEEWSGREGASRRRIGGRAHPPADRSGNRHGKRSGRVHLSWLRVSHRRATWPTAAPGACPRRCHSRLGVFASDQSCPSSLTDAVVRFSTVLPSRVLTENADPATPLGGNTKSLRAPSREKRGDGRPFA